MVIQTLTGSHIESADRIPDKSQVSGDGSSPAPVFMLALVQYFGAVRIPQGSPVTGGKQHTADKATSGEEKISLLRSLMLKSSAFSESYQLQR